MRFGPITLERRLKPGKWQDLPPRQIETLARLVGLELQSEQIYQAHSHSRSAKSTAGIILQFPFYAGIMGKPITVRK